MRIAVVTLLWRNAQFAEPFVRTLADAAERAATQVELVALQNGPDGAEAAELLAATAADRTGIALRLEQATENLGFAGGMNAAARSTDADVIVIANLDLEFDGAFVHALRANAAELAGRALLAPSVRSPGDPAAEAGALRRDWLHRPSQTRLIPSTRRRVPAGNGSCIVLGRRLLDERTRAVGGLFDEEYHSYFEDVDLFWWATRADIPVWFLPELRVIHYQGGSFEGKFRFRDRTPNVRESVMANYRLTVWKNAAGVADLAGWIVGETGYLARCLRINPATGLVTYLGSWRLARERAGSIRNRRGSLRVRPPNQRTRGSR